MRVLNEGRNYPRPQAPLSFYHLQEKNERGPGIQSHVTNVGKMASRLPRR